MEEKVRRILERPFSEDLRRTRKGNFGKQLLYVEIRNYVTRLTEAFEGDWSFEIVEHRLLDAEVVVVGKLTAAGITRMAFGGSAITTARETGKPLSVADDLKSACADALKKCASLLGVGLDLYSDAEDESDLEPAGKAAPQNVRPLRSPRTPATKVPTETGGVNNKDGALTQRQASAIMKLAEQAGLTGPEIRTWLLRVKGLPLEKLGRKAASEVIAEMQLRLTAGRNKKVAAGGDA